MNILTFISDTIKYFSIFIYSFFIMKKILAIPNITTKIKAVAITSSVILGVLYSVLINYLHSIYTISILFILLSFCSALLLKKSFTHSIIITFLSLLISFIFYIFSTLIGGGILLFVYRNIPANNPVQYIFCALLELVFILGFFKIKRFSTGFYFLKDDNNNFNIISTSGFIFGGILIIIFSFAPNTTNKNIAIPIFCAIALVVSGIYIWIKRNMQITFSQKMVSKTNDILIMENKEKEQKIAEQAKLIQDLSIIDHKYKTKFKVAEEQLKKLTLLLENSNIEFGDELSVTNKMITDLKNNYINEVNNITIEKEPLPKTNVQGIDVIFQYMQNECIKNNIEFQLIINCSTQVIIQKYISQLDLETLIEDHLKDAIISITHSNSSNKFICATFELVDNCYEFNIYDSGIPFEIDTLVKLGTQQTTTHSETGGSGLGFVTTFKTLEKSNASIIIEEIGFENSNYSKCIKFKFDGKKQYIISSKRKNDIIEADIYNRIIT